MKSWYNHNNIASKMNVIGVRKPGNSINVFFADGDRDSLFNVLTEALMRAGWVTSPAARHVCQQRV